MMSEPPAIRLISDSGGLPSAVKWAHLLLEDRLRPGDQVVDATSGNGHDTLMLCRLVLPGGKVFAFDVQTQAIANTRERLRAAGVVESGYELILGGHQTLNQVLPQSLHGQLAAVMFNLGYLPGSDKTCITQAENTLAAVRQALDWLKPGGLLTVVVYPGHDGGRDEATMLEAYFKELNSRNYEVQHLRPVNRQAAPPECWVAWKSGKSSG